MEEEPDQKFKPVDESDALVHRLRHGRELVRLQINQVTSTSETEKQIQATPVKRLFARIFDLTWILLLLHFTLAAFLNLVHSNAFYLLAQSLVVQLGLTIILIPLALILEAAISSDCGNTPGKSLFGLKVIRKGQDKIKFKHYLARGSLIWIKPLAFGIPFLNFLSLLWQRYHLSKHKITSYDKSLGMQVIAVKTTPAKKLSLTLSAMLMAGTILYFMPTYTVTPAGVTDTWDKLQMNFKRVLSNVGIDVPKI